MKAIRIDHVQLSMPPDREAKARAFYSGVLGMTEVPRPRELRQSVGCWFELGAVKIHLETDRNPNFRAPWKPHPAIVVADLDELILQLRDAGHELLEDEPYHDGQGAFVLDPFGNRLEFVSETEAAAD